MALKRGPCFLLLILTCALLGTPSDAIGKNRPYNKSIVKKLIKKCLEKKYAKPEMTLLKAIFSKSNMPVEGGDGDQAETLLTGFLAVLNSATVGDDKKLVSRPPMEDPFKMKSKTWKCQHLSALLKKVKNSPKEPACYMRAFLAPVAWEAWNANCEDHINRTDYEAVLWTAKPMLEESSSARMNLPTEVDAEKMEPMVTMYQGLYDVMVDSERAFVAKWAKAQIIQNTFNCTMKPPSDPSSRMKKPCTAPKLNLDVLKMMGSFMSHMTTDDVDSSRKDKICGFLSSGVLNGMKGTKPTKCKWFLKAFQACYSGKDFLQHLDKLGPLTCCLSDLPPDLPSDVSRKVLAQLERCNNSMTNNLKKRLVSLFMSSKSSDVKGLMDLGKNAKFLALKQFLDLNPQTLKDILKNQSLQWTQNQQCMLVKKQLGDKCNEMSFKDMKDVPSLVKALPVCIIKRLKAAEFLNDTEILKKMSQNMRKGQLKAMLQKLPPGVLKKMMMPERLACSMSLSALKKANITSLEMAENKTWCRTQAAYLAKMVKDVNPENFRKLRSILGGISCKMIEKAADIKELAKAMAAAPQWLSKTQVRCAARKLFYSLEKEKKDYFKNITEEELDNIETEFLLHLPPMKLKELPGWVCPTFLEKLEKANLSLLPLRSWSRPALIDKALSCLADGTDLSRLAVADVSILGSLVCDLPPSKLTLMAPDVVNSTLETMADCKHIPRYHREDLVRLVKKTFGDPSGWTAETTETIGPLLLLLDENAVTALPKKPWMKDVFYFLMSKMPRVSNALRKKWFELATGTSSESTADSNNSDQNGEKNVKPTEQMIEEVGMSSCFWTPAQLDAITKETFQATAETLGACSGYNAKQLAVLHKKATEAFGAASQMADCQVLQLGCIAQGFSDADLETLPFSLDSLEDAAKCSWTESQMKAVWRGIATRNRLTAPKLEAADMVALSRFICGLSMSEIQHLNVDAFKDAVGAMDFNRCPSKVMQTLKRVALSAFGAPSSWDGSEISELSSIIRFLDASELKSLISSGFQFIKEASIPEIPPDSLKGLSEDQLRSLGPDNAAMVTRAQLSALSVSQRAALDDAATGSRNSTITPTDSGENSGAPSLDVENASALMKAFLFLCMGFLLL